MEVIVFGAKNCAGCVTVKRVLDEKKVEYTQYDVNAADAFETAMSYMIRSIPTVVFKDGDNWTSYTGEKECLQVIRELEG